MGECDRCGLSTSIGFQWRRDGRCVALCGTCNAEFEDWVDQDGVYQPFGGDRP